MLTRCLVLQWCVGILVHISAVGNHSGEGLASSFQAEKEERSGYPQVLWRKTVGEEEQEEIAQNCQSTSFASFLQSPRASTQYPTSEQNDLVSPTVSSSKQSESGQLQTVQAALECSMEATKETIEVPEQSTETREGSTCTGLISITESATRGFVGDLCREGPMDYVNTGIQTEQTRSGSRGGRLAITPCTEAATATAARSGQENGEQADRGREHQTRALQGPGEHEGSTACRTRCGVPRIAAERESADNVQKVGPQRHQQAGQIGNAEKCSPQKVEKPGFGMARLHTQGHGPFPEACSHVSSMPQGIATGSRSQSEGLSSNAGSSGQGVTNAPGGSGRVRRDCRHSTSRRCTAKDLGNGSGGGSDSIGRRIDSCGYGRREHGARRGNGECWRLRQKASEEGPFSSIHFAFQSGEQQSQEGQSNSMTSMWCAPDVSESEEDEINWYVGSMHFDGCAWMTLESEANLCNDERAKKVSFASFVDVEIVHSHESITRRIPCLSMHAWCRQLWELKGQTCEWNVMREVFQKDDRVPWLSLVLQQQDEGFDLGHDMNDNPVQTHMNRENHDDDHDMFHESREILLNRIAERPTMSRWYVETWFLSEMRFHVCFQSRRLMVERDMSMNEFEQAGKMLWADVLAQHTELTFQRVQPSPNGGQACLGHVLLMQGDPFTKCTMLLRHQGLPTPALRAVMFSRGDTTLDVMRIAQIDRPCHRADTACYICAPNGGAEFFDTHDIVEMRPACFMLANARIIHFSDEGESVASMNSDETSDEELQSTTIGSDVVEVQDDSDESSMMSEPTWVFRMPRVFEWPEQLNPEDEDELEDEQNEVTIHEDHIEDIRMHLRDEAQQAGTNEANSVAITFGIGLADLGRRDTEYRSGDYEDLRRKVAALWNDHVQFADAEIYMVYPQPRLATLRNIVLLIGFDYGDMHDPNWKKVLVMQESALDYEPRTQPYAARVDEIATENSVVAQLGLHACYPYAIRQCDFTIAGRTFSEVPRQMVVDGALIEVFVGPIPEYAARIRHMIAHSDDFFVQAKLEQQIQPKQTPNYLTSARHIPKKPAAWASRFALYL